MATLAQKIEDLKKSQNSLIDKLRADRSDKKIMEQYKNLDAQIKELKKEKNLQDLKNKIENFNEANNEVKKIIPLLIEYKDNILKVGGGHTKKLEDKISENYQKANGNYILTDGDKKQKFLNL